MSLVTPTIQPISQPAVSIGSAAYQKFHFITSLVGSKISAATHATYGALLHVAQKVSVVSRSAFEASKVFASRSLTFVKESAMAARAHAHRAVTTGVAFLRAHPQGVAITAGVLTAVAAAGALGLAYKHFYANPQEAQ